MSKDAKNVPALRFKGYSDAWEKRKLGELANIRRGASPRPIKSKKWFSQTSQVGWIRISDVTEQNGRIHQVEQHLSDAGQKKTLVLKSKHLLLSIAATVGKPVQNYIQVGVHDGFIVFMDPKFDLDFMFYFLEKYRPNWARFGQPGSQININSELVRDLVVSIPTVHEQDAVAQFIITLDNLIAATQDKLSFLKKMKMFFLQQIFPTKDHDVPQIRFDGFTDAWSHYKLGSLMRIDKEQEVKKELLTDIQKGFYVLAMRTFSMDGYIDHSKPYWLNHLDNVSDDKFLLPREFAILDADMDANLPKIGRVLLNASSEKYLLAAHVRKIQVKSGNDPIFIYALMRGNSVHERLKLEANGSISKRLLDKNVYKQSILVPNRSEQSKIGRLFFLLETTITLHQQKIQMLQQVKKSCLQNLFI